ncbi:MAG: CoA pyrophosphatase [Kurthia sp.]|nr:CoA pyrophosphatase [Candidatus Kurthia equi]
MKPNNMKDKFQKQPLFIGQDTAFEAAIIIPLVEIENQWHIVFELRSQNMSKQPGDVSFPGGKIDITDLSPEFAAIRETHEELGVALDEITILTDLSPFIFSPNFAIYPFVAEIPYQENYAVSEAEVEKIITIPLDWLLEHEPYMHVMSFLPKPSDDFPFEKIAKGRDYDWRKQATEEWFYEYEGITIWGVTARILKYFIEQLKNN